MSDWWKKGVAFPSDNPNFIKILDFYLFNCPVYFPKMKKVVSHRATIFEKTVWKDNLTTLLSEMKRNIAYQPVKSNDDVEVIRSQFDGNEQYIVFIENTELKITRSIFYAIRNSFAHGSFSVVNNSGKPIYYLESSKDGIIKSQIKLYESTLLKWIDLFNSPIEKIKEEKKCRKREKDRARRQRRKTHNVQTNS